MSSNDQREFLRMVQENDKVVITERDSTSPEVQPDPKAERETGQTLTFWNQSIFPRIKREKIAVPRRYRIDTLNTPTLEFTPSFESTWEGKPALGQGRLYGIFDPYLRKPLEFEKWYEKLTRWIRQNYRKSPESTGGYVGPAAYEFYRSGGYLLPNFLPPRTTEWLAKIGKQHSQPGVSSKVRLRRR